MVNLLSRNRTQMTRRSLFQWLAYTFHGAAGLIVGAPLVRFFLGKRPERKSAATFQRIAPLSVTSTDQPVRITVSADRTDAFTHYPPGPIGVVWLVRNQDLGGAGQVRCFQSVCPHLGCAIDFASERGVFFCPCHASEFAPDGSQNFGPSPRGMDELPCRLSEPDDNGERWVEVTYQEFRTGTKEPIPTV